MQTGRYKHHQIWAAPDTVTALNWGAVKATYGWVANPEAADHAVDGWFSYVGVGPLCWHQHIDLAYVDLASREGDLLADFRGSEGAPAKLPRVADRPALKAAKAVVAGRSQEVLAADGLAEGGAPSIEGSAPAGKRKKRNRFQRVAASYTNGTWEARARRIVEELGTVGLGAILPTGKFERALMHMQK